MGAVPRLGCCYGSSHERAALREAEERINCYRASRIEAQLQRACARIVAHGSYEANGLCIRLRDDARFQSCQQFFQLRDSPYGLGFPRRRRGLGDRVRNPFFVGIPAAAGLAAEQACRDARFGEKGRAVLRLLEVLLVHRLHHRVRHVEADEVHEAEGAEAKARRVDEDAIDRGEIRYAFGEDAQRFGDVGAAGVVDDEARGVLAAYRRVASAMSASLTQASVSSPATTSTIFITGTGLKK